MPRTDQKCFNRKGYTTARDDRAIASNFFHHKDTKNTKFKFYCKAKLL